MKSFKHNPSLDGIRGVAIALVLLGHTFEGLPGLAAAGVALFFVLSGFLITSILLAEHGRRGSISLKRFYARRALRLLPALFVLLLVAAVWAIGWSDGESRTNMFRSIWTSFAYLSNWFQAFSQPYAAGLGHTWSLANEEQFYLLWPLALILLLRVRQERPMPHLAVLIVGAIVVRSVLYHVDSPIQTGLYFSPFTWADSLLIGCGLAILRARDKLPGSPTGSLLGASTVYISLAIVTGSAAIMFNGGVTVQAFGLAIFVWSAAAGVGRLPTVLAHKSLTYLGRISYGTYLWQGPIVWRLARAHDASLGIKTLAVGLSLIAGAASYQFVEKRFLRMKERFAVAG